MIRTRMSKTGWEKTDWVLCFAFSVMIALIGLPAVAPGAATPAVAGKAEVNIDNFNFSPATLTVKAGTQITWTNGDDIPHTVVGDGRTFKSKVLGTGEKFTFTASKPGTYSYSCSIHPNMTGKVVVE
jgi:plastocyanin